MGKINKIDLLGVIIFIIILIYTILVLFFIETPIKVKIGVLILLIVYNELFGLYLRKKEKHVAENNKEKFSQYIVKKKKLLG